MIVAAAIGAVVLVPSLWLLFSLFLHGRFDPHTVQPAEPAGVPARRRGFAAPQLGVLAGACLVVGATLTFFFEDSWAHVVGVTALLAFVGLGFVAVGSLVAESE